MLRGHGQLHDSKGIDPEHVKGMAKCMALENGGDRVRLVAPESKGSGVRWVDPKNVKDEAK